jgi:hypothetical protein
MKSGSAGSARSAIPRNGMTEEPICPLLRPLESPPLSNAAFLVVSPENDDE